METNETKRSLNTTALLITAVLIMAVLATFFAARYHRDEQLFAQMQEINRMNGILLNTQQLLKSVPWDYRSAQSWRSLGYDVPLPLPTVTTLAAPDTSKGKAK